MGMVLVNGKQEKFIKVNGKIIKCTEKEFLHGLMENNMKVSFFFLNFD
jgi:hypothetical protein